MKFQLDTAGRRMGGCYKGEEKKELEAVGCVFDGTRIVDMPIIEMSTIEELADFIKERGDCIVEMSSHGEFILTIYDDYIE